MPVDADQIAPWSPKKGVFAFSSVLPDALSLQRGLLTHTLPNKLRALFFRQSTCITSGRLLSGREPNCFQTLCQALPLGFADHF